MALGRTIGAAALALTLAPAPAGADAPGVEVGVGSSLVLIFPTIGGHVSVPTHTGLRVEAGTQFLPWLLEDGDDFGLMTHVQLRIPVRSGPPGSRRSWLAGITAFSIGDRWDLSGNWSVDTMVRPHVGFSWQWQRSPRLDLRLDAQAIVTGEAAPFVAPFATFSLVWHRERRWS
jgi:hypothetical protein